MKNSMDCRIFAMRGRVSMTNYAPPMLDKMGDETKTKSILGGCLSC
jgi:hypothetical protein